MKKIVICFFALCLGYGAFAQTKAEPAEEKVTITEERVFEEVKPEAEAKKFANMLAKTTEISEVQKDKIYKVVLKAMKEKKALAGLRNTDEDMFKEKEDEIFRFMNDEVNAIIAQN